MRAGSQSASDWPSTYIGRVAASQLTLQHFPNLARATAADVCEREMGRVQARHRCHTIRAGGAARRRRARVCA
eukprot:1198979-Pleurochrysis_carterae.AAC.3